MFKHLVGCAVIVLAASSAFAQAPQQAVRARQRISTMEAVLERAVSFGADNVIEQVSSIVGDQPRLLGAPRARGFHLEGYGVVFDVDVPSLTLPLLWPVRHLVDDVRANAYMSELRLFAAQLEQPDRAQLEGLLAKIQSQASPAPGQDRLRQNVSAASLAPETVRMPAPAANPPVSMDDPVEAYRKEVKAALVNAMLESSGSLTIGPDEWLTVAARSNVPRDPLSPGDTVASTTWIARVKGSDLAAFRAQKITAAEARRLVQEREQ